MAPARRSNPRRDCRSKPYHIPENTSTLLPRLRKPNSDLLKKNASHIISVGVDFGTHNTSAAWVQLEKGSFDTLDYIKYVKILHTKTEQIRHPTVMTITSDAHDKEVGRLAFAESAVESLGHGHVRARDLIRYPKLGLVTSCDNMSNIDKEDMTRIRERYTKAISEANRSYKVINVVYPDDIGARHPVSINNIDDVIVQYLRYFRGLLKVHLAEQLHMTLSDAQTIFDIGNIEVGFAAPTFWSNHSLDKFLHLLEKAGWPSRTKIWSEPKAAAVGYIANARSEFSLTKQVRAEYEESWLNTIQVVCDMGAGTLDTTSIRAQEVTEDTIRFATAAESGGSLSGGRYLESLLEKTLVRKLGVDHTAIRRSLGKYGQPMHKEDFLQTFCFDECRNNYNADPGKRYCVPYRGDNLPAAEYDEYMTLRSVELASEEVLAAHDEYFDRVLDHIEAQLCRTQSEADRLKVAMQVVLCGGITRSQYLVQKLQAKLRNLYGVEVLVFDQAFKPLVAYGCLISLRQPSLGGRSKSREAYGIPLVENLAMPPPKQSESGPMSGSRPIFSLRREVDIVDWIVQVGQTTTPEETYISYVVITWEFLDDDGTPRVTDPRKDHDLTITIRQQILSCADPIIGRTKGIRYTDKVLIDKRKQLNIVLNKRKLLEIEELKGYEGVGFGRNKDTDAWVFRCEVRILLDWPDMRLRWRVQIPKSGYVPRPEWVSQTPVDLWEEELFLSTNDHGVEDGDEVA